jgi:hypothetical protein
MPIVLKPGSLNLLEPSVPVQACNGIALPFPLPFTGQNNSVTFYPVELVSSVSVSWRLRQRTA